MTRENKIKSTISNLDKYAIKLSLCTSLLFCNNMWSSKSSSVIYTSVVMSENAFL